MCKCATPACTPTILIYIITLRAAKAQASNLIVWCFSIQVKLWFRHPSVWYGASVNSPMCFGVDILSLKKNKLANFIDNIIT